MAMKKYYVLSIGLGVVFFVTYASYGLAFWYGSELIGAGVVTPGSVFTVSHYFLLHLYYFLCNAAACKIMPKFFSFLLCGLLNKETMVFVSGFLQCYGWSIFSWQCTSFC